MKTSVVVGQIPVTWDIEQNLAAMETVLADCQPGELVVFPEAAVSGYDDDLTGLDGIDADGIPHAIDRLAEQAVSRAVHLFCGSLLHEHGSWRNAAIYLGPDGTRWVYRKVNLATHERGRLAAGDELRVLQVRSDRELLHVGVQICREILFGEQWQYLAAAGAQAFVYLTYAVNPAQPAGVWRSHLISRAAANQRFVIAANIADPRQHCPSMIISPRGDVIAELPAGPAAVLRATFDTNDVSSWYLDQRRTDLLGLRYHGA